MAHKGVTGAERDAAGAPLARRDVVAVDSLVRVEILLTQLVKADDAKVGARKLERPRRGDAARHCRDHRRRARLVVHVQLVEDRRVHPPANRGAEEEDEKERADAGRHVCDRTEAVAALLEDADNPKRKRVCGEERSDHAERLPKAHEARARLHHPFAALAAKRRQHDARADEARNRVGRHAIRLHRAAVGRAQVGRDGGVEADGGDRVDGKVGVEGGHRRADDDQEEGDDELAERPWQHY